MEDLHRRFTIYAKLEKYAGEQREGNRTFVGDVGQMLIKRKKTYHSWRALWWDKQSYARFEPDTVKKGKMTFKLTIRHLKNRWGTRVSELVLKEVSYTKGRALQCHIMRTSDESTWMGEKGITLYWDNEEHDWEIEIR